MQWIVGGGQLVAGIAIMVLWWIVVQFVGRTGSKPLSAFRFVGLPTMLLLWAVAGFILIFRGIGLI